jgi:hypothetical protein
MPNHRYSQAAAFFSGTGKVTPNRRLSAVCVVYLSLHIYFIGSGYAFSGEQPDRTQIQAQSERQIEGLKAKLQASLPIRLVPIAPNSAKASASADICSRSPAALPRHSSGAIMVTVPRSRGAELQIAHLVDQIRYRNEDLEFKVESPNPNSSLKTHLFAFDGDFEITINTLTYLDARSPYPSFPAVPQSCIGSGCSRESVVLQAVEAKIRTIDAGAGLTYSQIPNHLQQRLIAADSPAQFSAIEISGLDVPVEFCTKVYSIEIGRVNQWLENGESLDLSRKECFSENKLSICEPVNHDLVRRRTPIDGIQSIMRLNRALSKMDQACIACSRYLFINIYKINDSVRKLDCFYQKFSSSAESNSDERLLSSLCFLGGLGLDEAVNNLPEYLDTESPPAINLK